MIWAHNFTSLPNVQRDKEPVSALFYRIYIFHYRFFCAIEINFLWLFGYSPDMEDIKTPTMSVSSEVYTADGKLIGRFTKRTVPLSIIKASPLT
jgi:membrane carboxypeptidase/penicillin-binding protein